MECKRDRDGVVETYGGMTGCGVTRVCLFSQIPHVRGVKNSDGCMEATRSRSRTSSSESSRAPIRVCRARVLLSADDDESVERWERGGNGNWENVSNGSSDNKEELKESCTRSLPLAFGDLSSACESDLDRIYSCEPKKGLCIILLTSLSWGAGSTTSADGPSYWTTSADSHL